MKEWLVLLMSGALIYTMFALSPYEQRYIPQEVETTTVVIDDVYDTVVLRGTVVEQGREAVYAPQAASIIKTYVSVGQTVRKGELLVTLQPLQEQRDIAPAISSDVEKAVDRLGEAVMQQDAAALEQEMEALQEAWSVTAGATLSLSQEETKPGPISLYSPIDGVVMELGGEVGEQVSGFLPCVIVSDMDRLAVQAEINEYLVQEVEQGMRCSVEISALSAEPLAGTIETIMPYATQTGGFTTGSETKTQLLISLQESQYDIRPGYSAVARVLTHTAQDAMLIPYEALYQDADNREYVLVVGTGGVLIQQYVTTGQELAEQIAVLSGVTPWDELVLGGQDLTPGDWVVAIDEGH